MQVAVLRTWVLVDAAPGFGCADSHVSEQREERLGPHAKKHQREHAITEQLNEYLGYHDHEKTLF